MYEYDAAPAGRLTMPDTAVLTEDEAVKLGDVKVGDVLRIESTESDPLDILIVTSFITETYSLAHYSDLSTSVRLGVIARGETGDGRTYGDHYVIVDEHDAPYRRVITDG